MKMTFRWYGEGCETISLKHIRQIPNCRGLMGVLDEKAAGEVWEEEEIKAYVLTDEGFREFTLRLGELTDDERQIILDGCLINYYRG